MKKTRILSIDLLRGLVMIIMALDHIRDYFHADAFVFDPVDLDKTNVLLFFTRWITNFCAPVFVMLAGTSAFLAGRRRTQKQLSAFLLTRGLWLVFLELVVVNFAWFFNIHFSFAILAVIWALGVSMMVLAALIHLPRTAILITGIVLVAGHNLLDNFHVPGSGPEAVAWAVLHETRAFAFGSWHFMTIYPLLPWIGLMALGYCMGWLYQQNIDPAKRKRLLWRTGSTCLLLFILLRSINVYGDLIPWSRQSTPVFSFLSFINVTKYPPSLDYVLLMIGPALLFLAFTEKPLNRVARII
ncbi:MAG TPA: heparan-alpha-glucosaminide N-acetyltransferase domain-containing protein, partial [Puia sp.]|nr:heparan-alpha-glucosaminide N-acetyltransferase domain-containing protein [Puia sp.]